MRSELTLIREVAALDGVEGIGDDCAIITPRAGEDLLFTTDMLIEDVHFRRDTHSAAEVGHKALARGLSDIAAMGGDPRFCLLSLALAPWTGDKWIRAFYRGLLTLARRYKCPLSGGDLSHSDRLTCDIVVCGGVPKGRALRRDGARPGDRIYVSAPLGKPWQTHRKPNPRIELGRALRSRATSCMDLTDGLALDLHRLALASGVSAELDSIPVVRGSTQEQALHGGEDYELLFTLPARRNAPAGSIAVGRIAAGKPGSVLLAGTAVAPRGYDHLAR